MHLKIVLFNNHPRPHEFKQFVLADHAITVLHQREQQVKGARAELAGHTVHQ